MSSETTREQTMYFVSIGAGSASKPAIVGPNGDIIAIGTSPQNAADIVTAMNAMAVRKTSDPGAYWRFRAEQAENAAT